MERQGSVCPSLLHHLRQTAKTTSESRLGVVQDCHLVTSTLDVLDHRWRDAHTRSKWHSPSICEESDRSAFFLIILGVQITSSLT